MTIKYRNGILIFSFSRLSFQILRILLPLCLVVATACYLFSQTQIPIFSSVPGSGSSLSSQFNHLYDVAVSGEKGSFVKKALQTEIDGPFDGEWISRLCNSREWVPGLIAKCDAPQGGIGNVRNVFLNCIRYAIEAGGMSSPLFLQGLAN